MDSKISKKEIEIFRDSEVFPSAGHLLQIEAQPIENVLNHCLVVIDTNVLLLPFTIDQKDLRSIEDLYGRLRNERRIFVPAQVAREFVKNRASKLSELINNLNDLKSRIHSPQIGQYPLLQDMDEYQHVLDAEKNIKESTRALQDTISLLIEKIKMWSWNDPVSIIYSRIFTEDEIVELTLTREETIADFEKRASLKIPPGFKDSKKADGGIGDILIWHTILQLGREHQKPLIFVTGEEKADWWHKSGGKPLYPRFELVEEYWRETQGQSFHIVPLSKMLEIFGQNEAVIDNIRQSEMKQKATKLDVYEEALITDGQFLLRLMSMSRQNQSSLMRRFIPAGTLIDLGFGLSAKQITDVIGFDLKLKDNLGLFGEYFQIIGVDLAWNLENMFVLGKSENTFQLGAVPSQELGTTSGDVMLGAITLQTLRDLNINTDVKDLRMSFDLDLSIIADSSGKTFRCNHSEDVILLK